MNPYHIKWFVELWILSPFWGKMVIGDVIELLVEQPYIDCEYNSKFWQIMSVNESAQIYWTIHHFGGCSFYIPK